jgi:peroxiredoxin
MKKLLVLSFLVLSLSAFRQEPYEINDAIQDFSLANALDNNNMVSLSDFAKSKAVVLVFNSPSCAFCKIYDDRLVQLANDFKGQDVTFLFINPNNASVSSDDSPSQMAKRAKEKGYTFPYLIDGNQKIANRLGATKTPEAFVLKNVNGSFVLKYKGAIDDNPQLSSDVTSPYLKDAITAVLSNTAVKVPERRATGCMIKK